MKYGQKTKESGKLRKVQTNAYRDFYFYFTFR